MPIVRGVPLVTQLQVEGITHEKELDNLDIAGATIDQAIIEATNHIYRWLRGNRGIDPAQVSNVEDFEALAAYLSVLAVFEGEVQDNIDAQRKVEIYTRRVEEEKDMLVVETTQPDGQTLSRYGRPVVLNHDDEPRIARGGRLNFPVRREGRFKSDI